MYEPRNVVLVDLKPRKNKLIVSGEQLLRETQLNLILVVGQKQLNCERDRNKINP